MDRSEYETLRRGAVWPLKHRTAWRFSGSDRVRYLNGQVTQDVRRLGAESALHAALVTAKGRLVADVVLIDEGPSIWLDAPRELETACAVRLERYIVADDVAFEPVTEATLFHAWGEEAEGAWPGELWRRASDRLGWQGWDILVAIAATPAGRTLCSDEAAEVFRIEAGIPRWGRELSEATVPPEANCDARWIRYDKGCYIGQEIIARLKSVGHPARLLMGILCEDGSVPALEAIVHAQGQEIGRVTSAAHSPGRGRGLALGYIRWNEAKPGQAVELEGRPARLAALPFEASRGHGAGEGAGGTC